jgi:hypothetical protein
MDMVSVPISLQLALEENSFGEAMDLYHQLKHCNTIEGAPLTICPVPDDVLSMLTAKEKGLFCVCNLSKKIMSQVDFMTLF